MVDDRKRDLALAWRINRLFLEAWNGKLPDLATVLGVAEPKSRQNGKQMAATLHVMAAMYGGTITYGKPVRAHG